MHTIARLYFFAIAFFMVILLSGCVSGRKKNPSRNELFKVEVMITQTTSYCGGARPSEEILQDLNTLRPAPGLKFFIGKGDSNNGSDFVTSSITDESGKAVVELSEGNYYLVFEDKTEANKKTLLTSYRTETRDYSAIDVSCLEAWFVAPEATFDVQKNKVRPVVLNHHIPCSWSAVPCVEYRGPLPP